MFHSFSLTVHLVSSNFSYICSTFHSNNKHNSFLKMSMKRHLTFRKEGSITSIDKLNILASLSFCCQLMYFPYAG
jgi:hypothetical protein